MSRHAFKPISRRVKIGDVETDVWEYGGRCRCGWTSPWLPHRQGPEDEHAKHLRYIERVRSGLAKGNPTLKDQRDYYLSMADDKDTPPKDAEVWKQLADELTVRLGKNEPEQTSPLW